MIPALARQRALKVLTHRSAGHVPSGCGPGGLENVKLSAAFTAVVAHKRKVISGLSIALDLSLKLYSRNILSNCRDDKILPDTFNLHGR